MITNITVRGFQSLGNVSLETGPLTVICGPSDVGKSALIRALRSLLTNRYPRQHVQFGHSSSLIAVDTEDGGMVAAQKGGGENKYAVGLSGGEREVFNKVGTDVPALVHQVLGWTEHAVGAQFDPLFLVAESGPHRARVLGEISNFAVLLEAVRRASSYARREAAEERAHTESSEQLRLEEGEAAQALERAEAHRDVLVEKVGELDRLDSALARVEGLLEDVTAAASAGLEAQQTVNRLSEVADLSEAQGLFSRLQGLETLRDAAETAEGLLVSAEQAYRDASNGLGGAVGALEDFCSVNPVCPVCGSEDWHG